MVFLFVRIRHVQGSSFKVTSFPTSPVLTRGRYLRVDPSRVTPGPRHVQYPCGYTSALCWRLESSESDLYLSLMSDPLYDPHLDLLRDLTFFTLGKATPPVPPLSPVLYRSRSIHLTSLLCPFVRFSSPVDVVPGGPFVWSPLCSSPYQRYSKRLTFFTRSIRLPYVSPFSLPLSVLTHSTGFGSRTSRLRSGGSYRDGH